MRVHRWVVVSVALVASACYTSVPLETTTPPVGQTVAFVLNDAGRSTLGDRIGPSVDRIEGRVAGTDGDMYVINVFSTRTTGGAKSLWAGEEMRLDRNFVSRLEARELSKRRTWLAAGVATSVVAAFILTRGLTGLFGGDDPEPPTELPPVESRGRPTGRP